MSNPRNHGHLIGRLANDPKVFDNADGSKKILFTIYADRNYTNSQNERDSDGIPVEAFVRAQAQGLGVYGIIHRGDLVSVDYALRMDRYRKDGNDVFDLKVESQDLTPLESRKVTQARLHDRLQAAEARNQALQAQAPAPAVQTSPVADEQLPFGATPATVG